MPADVLGSPEDDSTNASTARMLLLLESQPIYDEVLYGSLLERIISFYYSGQQDVDVLLDGREPELRAQTGDGRNRARAVSEDPV